MIGSQVQPGLSRLTALLSVPDRLQALSCAQAAPKEIDQSIARRDSAGTLWYEASRLGLEGQGWKEAAGPYQRFPSRAKAIVREEVWSLSSPHRRAVPAFQDRCRQYPGGLGRRSGHEPFRRQRGERVGPVCPDRRRVEIPRGGAAGTGPHRASAGRKPQR